MSNVATLGFKIETDQVSKGVKKLDDLSGAAKRVQKSADGMGNTASGAARKIDMENRRAAKSAEVLEKSYSRIPGAIKLVTTALVAMAGAAVSIRSFVSNTIEAEAVTRQLQAAIASTGGAAGLTVKELQKMASGLQSVTKYGDESIQNAQGILLTFTKIGKETFPRAAESVLDVAERMGTDLKSAALQVGKALNDPIRGIDGLSRAGIQFSDDQKTVIKQLAETGQVAQAQAIILKELENQFGGSARAARQTLGGALTSLSNSWGDLFEVSSGASNKLRGSIEALITAISRPEFSAFISMVGVGLFNALTIAARATAFVTDHLGDLFDILKIIVAAKTVSYIATLGASFLNLAVVIQKVGITTALFSKIGKSNIVIMAALAAIVAKATGYYDNFEQSVSKLFNSAKSLLPDSLVKGIDDTIASITSFDLESAKLADNFVALQSNADGLAGSFTGAAAAAKTAASAAKIATKDANDAAKAAAKQVAEGVTFAKDVTGGFLTDLRSGLEQGKGLWGSFADAALSALDKITDRLLNQVLDAMFQVGGAGGGVGGGGFLSSIFGGLFGGGGSGASGVTLGGVYHKGGVAGAPGAESRAVSSSVFSGAPRYHGGGIAGLKPNEVPAILEKGETIIPNGASASGGGQVQPAQIQVNVHGGDGNAEVSQRQDGNTNVVDIVLGEVRKDIAQGGVDSQFGSRYGARPKTRRR